MNKDTSCAQLVRTTWALLILWSFFIASSRLMNVTVRTSRTRMYLQERMYSESGCVVIPQNGMNARGEGTYA